MKKVKKNTRKTRSKVILLFLLMAIVLNIVVIGIAGYVYTKDIKQSYARICSGVSQVVASSVNGGQVEAMLDGSAVEDYTALKNRLLSTHEQIPDLERIYIYDMRRDGMYLIMDTKNADTPVGEKFDYPQSLSGYIDTFYEGGTPEVFESTADGHFIMTSLLPVFDIRNNCVCYVGCDIDMDEAYSNRIDFIKHLTLIVLVPTIVIALITAIYIKRRILSSIDCLDDYLKLYYGQNENSEL